MIISLIHLCSCSSCTLYSFGYKLSPPPDTHILRVMYLLKKETKHTVNKVINRFDC